MTLSLSKLPQKTPVIPNEVREVRTAAPFRAFCGKNPSLISPQATAIPIYSGTDTPARGLGSLPSETSDSQLATTDGLGAP